MTVQYKTHRAYTVVVCAALCLSSAYESGGAKTEGLAELSRARHRRPQSMYSETAMIKRYMCDKTVYKSSPKKMSHNLVLGVLSPNQISTFM